MLACEITATRKAGDSASSEGTKQNSVDVFGLGHCCIDHLLVLNPYPEKGKKGEVLKSLVIGGGPVPTSLQTVARLGKHARFCGKVGADSAGRQVIDELHAAGVDTSPVIVDPDQSTPRAYIWIDPDSGARTVALDLGDYTWMTPAEFDADLAADCRVFLTDGRAAGASLSGLRRARECGVPTVLDIGTRRERLKEMLRYTDYAVVSTDLGEHLFGGQTPPGRLADYLLSAGAGTAVVTCGEGGVLWRDSGGGQGEFPGYRVSAYDTTGAGDVFHGAFIYGLLEKWDLSACIQFASAAAALSCRKLSGAGSIPDADEIRQLIRTGGPVGHPFCATGC